MSDSFDAILQEQKAAARVARATESGIQEAARLQLISQQQHHIRDGLRRVLENTVVAHALFMYQLMVAEKISDSTLNLSQSPASVGLSSAPHSGMMSEVGHVPLIQVPVQYRKKTIHPSQRHTAVSLVEPIWMEIARDTKGRFHICEHTPVAVSTSELSHLSVHIQWSRVILESYKDLATYLAKKIAMEDTRSHLYFREPLYP